MKIKTIVGYGAVALMVAIVAVVVAGLASGYDFRVIQGNSMNPTLMPGQLVITKPDKDVQVGDVILFTYNGGDVLHRAVGEVKDADGNVVAVETQGDNRELTKEVNNTYLTQVKGKLWLSFPVWGGVWNYLFNFPLVLSTILALVFITALPWEKIRRRTPVPETAT